MSYIKIGMVFALLLLILPLRQVSAAPSDAQSDVRILIDVSGSMKKNDPNNLRSPALRLVVGLLPDGATSGVWTFAKFVNMLVPVREVSEQWKINAENKSTHIHSRGLFTNIEQVLNKATNYKQASSNDRRSVILLSDGLVDISKDDKINQQSRQRILDDILPRLKAANVAVHTVALSEHADHELLRAISLATDGWYEQVNDAAQLQRIFLHLFEKAAQRDTVPLSDNYFKIDDSVSEITLLVFRLTDSKPTELVLPDQSRMTRVDENDTIRWHHEDNFDLITIDNPISGKWHIDADLDPDNRVMVVTDLKLTTTDLPNNILIGESFDFDASLTEKGQVIERQDFLSLVDAQLKEESESAEAVNTSLNSMQKKGLYQTRVGDLFQPGRNDVVITLKSETFERQRRQSVNVIEMPFNITVEQLTESETRSHRLTIKPDFNFIKDEPLTIAALLSAEDGSEWSYEVLKNSNAQWRLTLADLNEGEKYTLALQIRGETVKGRSLFLQPDPIYLKDKSHTNDEDNIDSVDEDNTDEISDELGDDMTDEFSDEMSDELGNDDITDEFSDEMSDEFSDEMSDDFDIDLAEDDTDLLLDEDDDTNEAGGMPPAQTLLIGNVLILVLVGVSIFLWRRKRAAYQNPGDLL
ncbi:MAG: hypothetical protein COA90_01855 [Gammaproteobacteria bacterium]|nr:MAG: hypothetical protein COA90_01855 [Gammaproteobacteria bacterium]